MKKIEQTEDKWDLDEETKKRVDDYCDSLLKKINFNFDRIKGLKSEKLPEHLAMELEIEKEIKEIENKQRKK